MFCRNSSSVEIKSNGCDCVDGEEVRGGGHWSSVIPDCLTFKYLYLKTEKTRFTPQYGFHSTFDSEVSLISCPLPSFIRHSRGPLQANETHTQSLSLSFTLPQPLHPSSLRLSVLLTPLLHKSKRHTGTAGQRRQRKKSLRRLERQRGSKMYSE